MIVPAVSGPFIGELIMGEKFLATRISITGRNLAADASLLPWHRLWLDNARRGILGTRTRKVYANF